MASTPPNPVKVADLCQISPPSDSAADLTLPLTFFDTLWIKFHPIERIFFYKTPGADSSFFYSSLLPQLKHSLSLSLLHFRPLAGNLVWPSESHKPYIHCTSNDAVSLTVAESSADFHLLSGDAIRDAADSRHYIPELSVSDTKAAVVAFQITFFPNNGFSIGICSHHAITDGKSIIMFLKAWAHMSRQNSNSPPPELTPFLDRKIIRDDEGLDMIYLNNWITLASKLGADSNPRNLNLLPIFHPCDTKLARGTFRISAGQISKLRQKAISEIGDANWSTFVLTYAYTAFNIVKSKGLPKNKKLALGFTADCRWRMDPPVPDNYFGNCVFPHGAKTEAGAVMEENGFVVVVGKVKEAMKGVGRGVPEGARGLFDGYMEEAVGIGVAGSHRFWVYECDFGWGKPDKVEVTSVDRTGSFSMAESGDGNGGVEIGLALPCNEMEAFGALFVDGLRNL